MTDTDYEPEDILRVLAGEIPDAGDTFAYTHIFPRAPGYTETHHYRVTGWLRRRAPYQPPSSVPQEIRDMLLDLAKDARRGAGPDDVPLEFCRRDQAEYVCGAGVAGVIARVRDVVVDGHVDFRGQSREEARRDAEWLAGEPLV